MAQRITGTILALVLLFLIAGQLVAQPRFEQSVSLCGGLYAAAGVGTNFYTTGRYDYFLFGGRYFVEGSLGIGSLQSKVLEATSKASLFSSDHLTTYEFSFAYDAAPTSAIPFVLFGVAGVREGDQTFFAGVIGIGKRIPLPGLFGSNALGVRYDVRDEIFSQRLNDSDSFVAHNIVATFGVQVYF